MTIHHFHLADEPFQAIADGRKTIETRLYEEKRQKINVGDELVFAQSNGTYEIHATVTELLRADSFQELFSSNDATLFGKDSIKELLDQIYTFYSVEDEEHYGVVGIRFAVKERVILKP